MIKLPASTPMVFTPLWKENSNDQSDGIVAATIYLPGHVHQPINWPDEYDPNGRVTPQRARQRQAYSAMRHQGYTDNQAETRRRELRLSKWNQNERIFYLSFRISIKFLKKAQPSCPKHHNVLRKLKDKLPSIRQLSLEAWTDIRLKEGAAQ